MFCLVIYYIFLFASNIPKRSTSKLTRFKLVLRCYGNAIKTVQNKKFFFFFSFLHIFTWITTFVVFPWDEVFFVLTETFCSSLISSIWLVDKNTVFLDGKFWFSLINFITFIMDFVWLLNRKLLLLIIGKFTVKIGFIF